MSDAERVDTPEKLRAWLEALPRGTPEEEERARRIAVTIAFRAAARVFPITVYVSSQDDLPLGNALRAFRCLVSAFAAGRNPDDKVRDRSRQANHAMSDIADALAAQSAATVAIRAAAEMASQMGTARHAPWQTSILTDAASTASALVAADVSGSGAQASNARTISNRAVAKDITTLQTGSILDFHPIWPIDMPAHIQWREASKVFAAAPDDWSPVIEWYEHLLDPRGVPLDPDMMEEIALIPSETWDAGPSEALPVIGEIWRRYRGDGTAPEEGRIDLLEAALFDFTLDQIDRVMRAVPMPEDWRTLDDAEAMTAFLSDAEELRESFEELAKDLRAEGTSMQGSAAVANYLSRVLTELDRAPERGSLRSGKLLEYGHILERSLGGDTRQEFGETIYAALEVCVGKLRTLMRTHFARTLARVDVLRGIEMEEDADPWAVLNGLRDLVAAALDGADGRLVPLAAEDAAVLQDVLDTAERLILRRAEAQTPEARESTTRELTFFLAHVGATVGLYRERAKPVAKAVDSGTDAILKHWKKGAGLAAILEVLRARLLGGG